MKLDMKEIGSSGVGVNTTNEQQLFYIRSVKSYLGPTNSAVNHKKQGCCRH